jgi:hypothetical protein
MDRTTNYSIVWNGIQVEAAAVNTEGAAGNEAELGRGAIPTGEEPADHWLQKALERSDADELYVHGSQQQFLSFNQPQLWRGELIFFSRLSDKMNLDQFFGDTLYLCTIADAPKFDPATDPQASKTLTRLSGMFARKRTRLEFEDLPHLVPQAVRGGHRRFSVHNRRTCEFYEAIADARLATIVDVGTVNWGTRPRRRPEQSPEVAPAAPAQIVENHRGARILTWPTFASAIRGGQADRVRPSF